MQASGKTSFVNVVTSGQVESISFRLARTHKFGQWNEDVVPTVAFNFRKIRKGNVTMKVWDVAGALCFRVSSMFLDVLSCRTAEIPFHVGKVL